jgi:hypothetical protein
VETFIIVLIAFGLIYSGTKAKPKDGGKKGGDKKK